MKQNETGDLAESQSPSPKRGRKRIYDRTWIGMGMAAIEANDEDFASLYTTFFRDDFLGRVMTARYRRGTAVPDSERVARFRQLFAFGPRIWTMTLAKLRRRERRSRAKRRTDQS